MPWFGSNAGRAAEGSPESEQPPDLPETIDRLTVSFRELTDKRDRLEDEVGKYQRRVAEAEDELAQIQRFGLELSWRPLHVEKQRLAQYRDKLRTQLDATRASIEQARLTLVRQYSVAQASRRTRQALTVPCPVCGQPAVPKRAGSGGRGWRKGWYECSADDCDTAWSAKWSSGVYPDIKLVGL